MNLQRYLPLLFFLQVALFAQTKLETEINRIKDIPGITLEYLDGDRLSVNYDGVKTRVFYIGDKEPPKTIHKDVPSFVFNISELDTSLFNHRYSFWQEVPIASSFFSPTVGDIDNDGRTEIYGYKKDFFTEQSEVYCYEQDNSGIFQSVYKYPENTINGFGIHDVDRKGGGELHLLAVHFDSIWGGYVHDQSFFNSPLPNTLATEFYFDYNIYRGGGFNIQLDDFTVGDFNNDEINEAVFINFSPQEIWMTKFNENDLTFDSLLSYPLATTENMKGFAIDDFDLDGKTDIIYSATMGNVYVLENEHSDNYAISWQGNIGISNAYLLFKTNDLDKNGKPEFWVGGEDLSEGFTKLVCFESLGNNSYYQVATIKLLGLASLNVSNGIGIDVDNDFNDELFVKVGNYCLIIKFTGSSNNHNYEVYYFYKADNVVQSADMVQFPSDDRPSLVMSMYESNNGNRRDFSHILRHQQTTDLKDDNTKIINDYKIFKNYPNPFNPSTNVSFWLSQNSEVSIIVYNLLGEEVITLLSNTLNKGAYKIVWNGNDKYNQSVPSGVYFISLKARSTSTDSQIQKTLKSVLLK